MSVTRLVIVICMMGWSPWANAQAVSDCTNFRCRFGDVPKSDPPLIVEPFVSFYRDSVVRPMRPYHDWAPTDRRLHNASAETERERDLPRQREEERGGQ